MSDHKDPPPSYDSVAGTTHRQPTPEPAPRESTSRGAASTVDSRGYVPNKCMRASWSDNRHPRWVKMEGENGVICSKSGGVICSEHGGVLCSDHGGFTQGESSGAPDVDTEDNSLGFRISDALPETSGKTPFMALTASFRI